MKKEIWTIALILIVATFLSQFNAPSVTGKSVAHECIDADFERHVDGNGYDKDKAIAQQDAVSVCSSELNSQINAAIHDCGASCQQLSSSCVSLGGGSSVIDPCELATTVCTKSGFWPFDSDWHCTEHGAAKITCDCEYQPY